MKILLVRPQPSEETIGLQHVMIVEPLELEILAALIRSHDQVVLVDMILEKKPFSYFISFHKPDILCVTGYITNVPAMIQYCTDAKKQFPAIKTIVGGVHCEVCPHDLESPSIDFRVVRNASTQFTALLDHIEKESPLPRGVLPLGKKINEITLPAFDFSVRFPNRAITNKYRKQYFYIFHDKVALLKTSFGCPYTCSFCFCRHITQGAYATRPMDEVIEELAAINEKDIYIVDDDFLCHKNRVEEFIQRVIQRGIQKHYLIYGRADFVANNPDTIKRFKNNGLRTIIIGFESFFDSELSQYNKNTTQETNLKTMHILNHYKIDCFATIIVSPSWGFTEFKECGTYLKQLGITFVNLQPLTPLPGTDLPIAPYTLILKRSDYPQWDLAHVSLAPQAMSVAEFYRQILKLYTEIIFQPKVIASYIRQYSMRMLIKMLMGSFRVRAQYRKKIRSAQQDA